MGDAQVDATERSDGRTARRDRNRDAVLDAVLDIFRDDSVQVTPATVAERSGVSLRSVYRYFDDMDELVRAAMSRHLERFSPLFALEDLGVGSVAERAVRITQQRMRLYEEVGPMARAAMARAETNPLIKDRLEQAQARLTAQVEAMFAPELDQLDDLDRRRAAAAVDVLLGFEAIAYLRRTRELASDEVNETLTRSVLALLDA